MRDSEMKWVAIMFTCCALVSIDNGYILTEC
jgi:hypothetical protein